MHTKRVRLSAMVTALLGAGMATGSGQVQAYNADSWQDARQVYQKICGHCHDTGIGPVIQGRELPVHYIKLMVRHGNRAMPAFRPSDLSETTLNDLARLISDSATATTLADN